MKLKFLSILFFVSVELFATVTETIHSSLLSYLEFKEYAHSKQKKDGATFGLGADIHYEGSTYKVVYESAKANTYKPPLKEDLEVQKLFLQYGYSVSDKLYLHLNYMNILNDNIAITSHGQAYALGITYKFPRNFTGDITQYMTDYADFNVLQSDLKLNYKFTLNSVGMRVTSISKYISLDEKSKNAFTKNAQSSYLTTGIKFHSHYKSFHVGMGAYFGRRAFAIMNDGFKIQHHAMEFDRTYALGVGYNVSDFVLRFQYIYQRAIELPINNENVKIDISRLSLNYKF